MTEVTGAWFEGPHRARVDTAVRNASDAWDHLYRRAHTNGDVVQLWLDVIAELTEAARLAGLHSCGSNRAETAQSSVNSTSADGRKH